MAEKKKAKFLSYKGKPLVRCGNTIYYGNMNEPYVILIQIKSSKKVQELEVADKVVVQLVKTDPTLRPKDSIVKKADKMNLFQAMDIGVVWLDLALKK
ncbi:MAG TPA: hypothetical protein DDY98_07585 [Ruminococcaceae bacterium]|nr:hypothetical protein [Oscillospiraceae bacterium]